MKLTADILLHPGRPLAAAASASASAKRRRGSTAAIRPSPTGCRAYLPLFGLRWVLILLNEFIPERWQRRVLAGETGSWSDVKARQLVACAANSSLRLPEKLED